MATTTSIPVTHQHYSTSFRLLPKFMAWCNRQENNRIMWTGIALSVHGCIITPLTMLAVVLSGVPMLLLVITVAAIFVNLVVNLAAMPARITIPVFVLSILADIGVIAAAISMGLNFGKIF